jgi:hypothetical protein
MPLPGEEYSRRKRVLDAFKRLSAPQCVQVARILKAHGVRFSANDAGLWFDLALVEQPVMDELYRFLEFTVHSASVLAVREAELSTLTAAVYEVHEVHEVHETQPE